MNKTETENLINVEEECFCLKFELDAIANLTIRGEAERWVPGFIWPINEKEHQARYDLALKYVGALKVLDVACGSGYGSYLLAKKGLAAEVFACDLDDKAIRYGNARYPEERVLRSVQNAQEFRKENYFDVVVSFETIEHLDDYNAFLENIQASLKMNGVCIISTPIVSATRVTCENPYHKIEWSFTDFQHLINQYLNIEEVYVQSIVLKEKPKSIWERILLKFSRRLFPRPTVEKPVDPFLQRFNGQYEVDRIMSGYQVIVSRKK